MKAPIQFGKYLLVDRINVGGMAEVFMAKSFGVEGFERVLAIKRILPNMADDDEFINMFVDEARIAVQLSHANIVQIYELGKFENQYYIAMEYVSGKDLRQILDGYRKKQQNLPIPAAAYIASKVCEGLDYAHRKTDPSGRPLNVIHRDVSPQNILVSFEGAVKITDFGIAKAEDRASKTQAGVLKGKFGYMSPEQVRGLEIDHRSDVFALGILLYEMMTGRRLFVGESDFSTLEKVRNAQVTPPRELVPEIPEALERVMLKALARERDERYQWASELHDDLQQFLIEDNTIYNAKRVAALLRTDFPEDIERERLRMEDFMRMQAPQSVPSLDIATQQVHGAADVRAEKTMIFESADLSSDLSSAPTAVSPEMPAPPAARGRPVQSAAGGSRTPAAKAGPASRKRRVLPATRLNRHLGAVLVGISVLVSLTVILVVALTGSSGSVGTIIVTSRPTNDVEVYLDGQKIGSRTPITRQGVTAGAHTLVARARGYTDKAYRFELMPGSAPAVIPIDFDPTGAGGSGGAPVAASRPPTEILPPAPAGGALIEIRTEPSAASVRVGGILRGETPLTLAHAEATKPFIFEVGKPGYKTETITVALRPGEERHTENVKLASLAVRGKLVVRSSPEGAEVYSGNNRLGVTPLEIADLDATQTYEVRVRKEGFRAYQTTVAMAGRSEAIVEAALVRDPDRVPDRAPVSTPKRVAAASSSGGCNGSGAKLSVMAQGVANCKVTVGRTSLGVAPFVNKDAPVGKCEIAVVCPDGKRYGETRVLKSGAVEKLIVESSMWK